ncbi:hypothetical protein HAX54_049258 [Datura stramonium]|uniref:Uncharacterized protein n=1 Tax=Datura stramonium TaxID=4076 RepID=A0ABS8SVF6_DATST|nr:hypothetical protein [Datura stramonium]
MHQVGPDKGRVSLAAQLALLMTVQLAKIILSQEKNIQRLNELVRSLREQLLQCRSSNETISNSLSSLADIAEFEKQQILED